VKVLNDSQLFIPDVAGNKLFHGYGNIESNPKIGLIFFIPGHNSTVRINGRVKVIDRSELTGGKLEVFDPDDTAEGASGIARRSRRILQPLPESVEIFPVMERR